jgi:hypothetical protein
LSFIKIKKKKENLILKILRLPKSTTLIFIFKKKKLQINYGETFEAMTEKSTCKLRCMNLYIDKCIDSILKQFKISSDMRFS